MPLDAGAAGRSYPPTDPYEVGREKVREFAAAIGETAPACHDVDAARALGHADLVAPPTFATLLALRGDAQVVQDPDLAVDYARVVHGDQRFTYDRPIVAGDSLVVTTTIDAVRAVGGHTMLTTRAEIGTAGGEHVCTARSTLVVRGGEG